MIPQIPGLRHAKTENFFLIAGPCVVETEENVFTVAETVSQLADKFSIPYIFKSSYRKANRSRANSFTGIGDEAALRILRKVHDTLDIPVLTDVHSEDEAEMAAAYVDVLQIPAFLSRQTELLIAAARTGRFINIKKGQFLSPDAMKFAADKVLFAGNKNIILTERGTTFGYQDLVVDVTHSLQQPNQASGIPGGRPDLIETIARAAIAVGADGLFMETHPEPAKALSDGANMLRLELLEQMLEKLVRIRDAVKNV